MTPTPQNTMTQTPQNYRRWLGRCLIAGCLALLAWTLYQQRTILSEVSQHPWDWRLFGLGVGCVLGCELLTVFRWWILVQAVAPIPLGAAWQLGLTGVLFNTFAVGANTGDFVKAGIILASRVPRTLVVSSLVLDRLIGLLGLLLLASLAVGLSGQLISDNLRPILMFILAVTAIGILGFLVIFHPITGRLVMHLRRWLPASSALDQLMGGIDAFRRARVRMILAIGLAISSHLINIIGFYFVGRMLFPSSSVSLGQHLILVPLLLASTALPLPSGAIGVTEQIGQQLFQLVGHPGGALAMLGYRAAYLGAVVVTAVIYVICGVRFSLELSLPEQSKTEVPST